MEVLHPHCAGLDIHKDSVVAHGNRCVWRRKRQRLSPGMCHRYRNAVLVGGRELPSANNPHGSFPHQAVRVQ
jgi:hypothetical protein